MRSFALVGLLLVATSAAAADAPRVLGFERFHGGKDLDASAAGQLLLGELNCTSCHQADEALLATHINKKKAPILDEVGDRVRPQYLLKFLADPQATKPGTTMPNVLGALSEEKRKEAVEALVHFLAITGNGPAEELPRKIAVNRGEMLFHSVGCVACHDPRPSDGSKPNMGSASIALGTPSRKYTLPSLAKFLENPLAVRPSARMPHLLGPAEAKEVAAFLLNDLDQIAGLQYTVVQGSFDKLPDFGKLKATETGEADSFNLNVTKLKDHFGVRFDGHLDLPKDGDYEFWISSDDGSRLLIDDKQIVINDGIHAETVKQAKAKLSAGLHTVAVEYFEGAGGEVLKVQVKPPGGERQDLAAFLSVPKKLDKPSTPAADAFVVNQELAEKGKHLFSSLGCAACHSLKLSGQPVASSSSAKPLDALGESGGCLGDKPVEKAAFYGLNAAQKASLVAALKQLKQKPPITKEAAVHRSLVAFNCYACHERGKIGGVDEVRNAYFKTTTPEMGEEGRLPPHLNLVGAKLTSEWLKEVLDKGTKARPYVLTHMPRFGLANVGELAAAFETVDLPQVKAAPKVSESDDEKKFKSAGRKLVGAQGFGCIKCHVFGDKTLPGIQALDLQTMGKRLRPDWTHAYLLNPQEFRPGTRMPSPFPNGQSTLPTVLDGKADKQVAAIRAYLADGSKAAPPVGLVTAAIELVAYDEAIIYRNFIEGAGPRAIGVGYPEKINLAFDANRSRVALIWQNSFMDASKHWVGRGPGYQPPLGDNVMKFPEVVSFAILADEQATWPKAPGKEAGYTFKGYKLADKGRPIFQYSFDGVDVQDDFLPKGENDVYAFHRTLTLTAKEPPQKLFFLAADAGKLEDVPGGKRVDEKLILKLQSAAEPVVRDVGGRKQWLVPVKFENGKAVIVQTFDW